MKSCVCVISTAHQSQKSQLTPFNLSLASSSLHTLEPLRSTKRSLLQIPEQPIIQSFSFHWDGSVTSCQRHQAEVCMETSSSTRTGCWIQSLLLLKEQSSRENDHGQSWALKEIDFCWEMSVKRAVKRYCSWNFLRSKQKNSM